MAASSYPLDSYRHLVHDNHARFESFIQTGIVKPVLLWNLVIPAMLPVLALLVPHQKGARYVRPLVMACVIGLAYDTICHRRMLLGGNGYMGGLVPAWGCIWSATLLIFRNVECDFQRIERHSLPPVTAGPDGDASLNGHTRETRCRDATLERPETLTWQAYPQTLFHRLNWILGLVLNMRGPEWNWRISSLGALPPSVQLQLNPKHNKHNNAIPKSNNMRTCLRAAFATWLKSYLIIDLIKLLMIRDQYFLGAVYPSPDPPFPFHHLAPYPALVHVYRCLITGVAILAALKYVCSLNPLLFGGLSLAFPNAARTLTSVPLSAAWLYPPAFGPFFTSVFDDGLAGCWSQWWHQLFRFGFTSTAHWLLSFLPARLSNTRTIRRFFTVIIAFALSGLVHASGSYVQYRETIPLTGAFRFFILQAVGILAQEIISPSWSRCPKSIRRICNAVFALGWLLLTGGSIVEDFSRGGLWFTEPLPVSVLRGLGIGVVPTDRGWWWWGGTWFGSWDGGEGFWERGVRVY
ncbi:hypothetical protein BO94DRAFT_96727 [Aspergillus sclerotioniger CBS 115572]|uniref:Wax synthase domain-containing protein n=1 Tax=Aspergillus sclerotioniger CBS 115572 TaxID=1450535 RepID=A0A317WNE1_9EURO|nr:hypothetical protein BO94DRAFT_96727 [Aspergillus sclerotioniger CBS 115572]PWY85760.1 hypothetical protein BO94DRAFT_96727 [Aspergillus sclerotioniger CBS 115572]